MLMDVYTTSGELSLKRENWRQAGMKVGLVPTMGALHAGHLSLVEAMSAQADKIIVSLFVNPTQFAEGEDFDAYPRTTEDDLQKLRGTKADIVFMPDASEIYGDAVTASLPAGNLGDGLESETRPHFFSGVVTVVHKLFELCQPDAAIFGEKDYQQLLVIKQMVATHDMKIEILQKADKIFIDELKKRKLYHKIWQAFVVLLPIKSVGVMGDARTYEFVCALRAVTSQDGMTANYYYFKHTDLSEISNKIVNEVPGINRVVYDITSKPPGTIEWE